MLWCPLLNIEIYLKKKNKTVCTCVCLCLCGMCVSLCVSVCTPLCTCLLFKNKQTFSHSHPPLHNQFKVSLGCPQTPTKRE